MILLALLRSYYNNVAFIVRVLLAISLNCRSPHCVIANVLPWPDLRRTFLVSKPQFYSFLETLNASRKLDYVWQTYTRQLNLQTTDSSKPYCSDIIFAVFKTSNADHFFPVFSIKRNVAFGFSLLTYNVSFSILQTKFAYS